MNESSLFVETQFRCKVHPVVLFTILDHHMRRNEDEHRVIGTLMGSSKNGVIEIKKCFPVPHSESKDVAVDLEYHQSMVELHRKVSPKDIVLGWYSSNADIDDNTGIIFTEFYSKEVKEAKRTHNPIHLTVDTALKNDRMSIQTFMTETVQFGDVIVGAHFEPIPFELESFDAEKIGVDAMLKVRDNSKPLNVFSELNNLKNSVEKLSELLDVALDYVGKVLKKEVKPDSQIGRFIADALASLPKLDVGNLEQTFNNTLRDLLMVVYLANLTRSTLSLAEKVQSKVGA